MRKLRIYILNHPIFFNSIADRSLGNSKNSRRFTTVPSGLLKCIQQAVTFIMAPGSGKIRHLFRITLGQQVQSIDFGL